MKRMTFKPCLQLLSVILSTSLPLAEIAIGQEKKADSVAKAFDDYLAGSSDGKSAFTFDASKLRVTKAELAALPIGVFDSGIGGLTVLEAILTADVFDNENLKPTPDGRPDFEDERFIYLGDQANMPYGNYSKTGKTDYLRELILKDATFLLGTRHRHEAASEPTFDKPPVKAIVVACNTATAYGLEDIREAAKRWEIPVFVVGVVEAGARGVLQRKEAKNEGIGVLATVGTCASEVYPKTIQSTLGRAGRGVAVVTQHGSADLAAIIEGSPSITTSLKEQIQSDVRSLILAHQESRKGKSPSPLKSIMLGCTHFPLIQAEIDEAFTALRKDPGLAPYIAETREYIDPAVWTARQLFQELAKNQIRASVAKQPATKRDTFYLSVPNPVSKKAVLNPEGGLDHAYKYGRNTSRFSTEDTVVVPMTRAGLTDSGRRLVSEKLPEVWSRLPAGAPENLAGPPLVTAKSWAIADGETGEILWEHGATVPRKTASITKCMSALVVANLAGNEPSVLDEMITVSEAADKTGGSTANVKAGEKVSVREALYGLMLPSGNDMGNAIAEHFHPRLDPPTDAMMSNGLDNRFQKDRKNFIAEMNRLAQKFGMHDTFYRVAYGDGGTPAQTTSSAADLCILGRKVMGDPLVKKVVGTSRYIGTITLPDEKMREQIWENTNELLSLDRGYNGIKTGSTRSSGRSFLGSGERDGRRLIVAVVGSDSTRARWSDTRNLFRWAWAQIK